MLNIIQDSLISEISFHRNCKKHIYISKKIDLSSLPNLGSLLEAECVTIYQYEQNSLKGLEADPPQTTLNLFLLCEEDQIFDQDFWNSLNSKAPYLVIPIFKTKESFDYFNTLPLSNDKCYHFLTLPFHSKSFESIISGGFKYLELFSANIYLENNLKDRSKEIFELTEIGKALSAEKNYNKLLRLILDKAKQLTTCDAATIYLVKKDKTGQYLQFILSDLEATVDEENRLPLDHKSISGYVALTGNILNIDDAYNLPKDTEFSLNLSYDNEFNYRTKSMLVLPMRDHDSEIIGVLQLINKKSPSANKLSGTEAVNREVKSFAAHDMELATSLAGQAAVAIESSGLEERSKEIKELTEIGKALATERNYTRLLRFILEKSKEVTGSDAGSIYLVKIDEETGEKALSFKTSDMMLKEQEIIVPFNTKSIAGYVAVSGKSLHLEDAYHIPADAEYTLNLDYDKKHSYRTKSMLVVPMLNQKNEVIGVLQLINKKKKKDMILTTVESMEKNVVYYDEHDIDLVVSIAGQAAVAIENNFLYQNIERLFEGFVKASVTAIESRDPTTSGHSERVAVYTVELAKVLDRADVGAYANIKFTYDQVREIRYASLLHDFGKVGVREKVLVKASKLYPEELELIKSRFNFIRRTLQYESSQRKVLYLIDKSREEALALLQTEDKNLENELKEVDSHFKSILDTNNPAILDTGDSNESLVNIAKMTYLNILGEKNSYLNEDEIKSLSIRRGSLGYSERTEIESHVTHTFEFLSMIPWTTELKDIPEIAYGHHEKLNGEGYPRALKSPEIPVQSKIMTVSDIFDALVANDRPYKKAVSIQRALDILKLEVKDDHVDPNLVDMFIEAKVFDATSQ